MSAVGSLRSNESVTLRPETRGRIAPSASSDGETVPKGLCWFVSTTRRRPPRRRRRANLELAQSTQQRNADLYAKKFISGQALDSSTAGERVRRRRPWRWPRRIGEDPHPRAFAGVVGIRNISVGDYVRKARADQPLKTSVRSSSTSACPMRRSPA